jgi:hypothetical protein
MLKYNPPPIEWTETIVNNCKALTNLSPDKVQYIKESDIWQNLRLNDMFYRNVFIKSGEIASIIGAYFGICLDVIFLNGTPQNINLT